MEKYKFDLENYDPSNDPDEGARKVIFQTNKTKGFELNNQDNIYQFRTNCINLSYQFHTYDNEAAEKGD